MEAEAQRREDLNRKRKKRKPTGTKHSVDVGDVITEPGWARHAVMTTTSILQPTRDDSLQCFTERMDSHYGAWVWMWKCDVQPGNAGCWGWVWKNKNLLKPTIGQSWATLKITAGKHGINKCELKSMNILLLNVSVCRGSHTVHCSIRLFSVSKAFTSTKRKKKKADRLIVHRNIYSCKQGQRLSKSIPLQQWLL